MVYCRIFLGACPVVKHSSASSIAYCVDLVNVDYRRCTFFGSAKKILDSFRPHPHINFTKLRSITREKGYPSFPGSSLGQCCLTSARRPIKDDASPHPSTNFLVLCRLSHIVNDFLQRTFTLLQPNHIGKGGRLDWF